MSVSTKKLNLEDPADRVTPSRLPVPGEALASLSREIDPIAPESVLRGAAGGVRGFWQCGERWIAFAGSAAEILVPAGPGATRRFDRVRAATDRLAEAWRPGGDEDQRPLRLLGGFAFGAERASLAGAGLWAEFPAARFVAPAVELVGTADRVIARSTARFAGSTPDVSVTERLESQLAGVLDAARRAPDSAAVPPLRAVVEATDETSWRRSVERALRSIETGAIRKVVLARAIDLELAGPPDPVAVLEKLRGANRRADLFFLEFAPGSVFLGAAPELLATLADGRILAMAVAGSAPRSDDPEEDDRLGRELLASRKNLLEHRIGVDEIRDALAPMVTDLTVDPEPHLHKLSGIQHLRTDLRARARPGCHVLDLVETLHPTAAVCGQPRSEAMRLLGREEREPRGWYAGPVGWLDTHGEGEFAPALRSAIVHGPTLRLHAGAGLVTGSRAGSEWEETRVKFRTMLRALGVGAAP